MSRPIDVWDVATFDPDLVSVLSRNSDLIRDYLATEDRIFLAHDYAPRPIGHSPRPNNPHGYAFIRLEECLGVLMETRTIRAWHYTRLTDAEVSALQRGGIHLSTPDTLCERLDGLVTQGLLAREAADALFAGSPFRSAQREARSGKFWMTSHPVNPSYSGVERLLGYWGGEVASFFTDDPAMLASIAAIGSARVIEVAVPLSYTRQAVSAGTAAISAWARFQGGIPSMHSFDVYACEPLPPSAVLRVHSEGDATFRALGASYPDGYVNYDLGRWKELTGEDD